MALQERGDSITDSTDSRIILIETKISGHDYGNELTEVHDTNN